MHAPKRPLPPVPAHLFVSVLGGELHAVAVAARLGLDRRRRNGRELLNTLAVPRVHGGGTGRTGTGTGGAGRSQTGTAGFSLSLFGLRLVQ